MLLVLILAEMNCYVNRLSQTKLLRLCLIKFGFKDLKYCFRYEMMLRSWIISP